MGGVELREMLFIFRTSLHSSSSEGPFHLIANFSQVATSLAPCLWRLSLIVVANMSRSTTQLVFPTIVSSPNEGMVCMWPFGPPICLEDKLRT